MNLIDWLTFTQTVIMAVAAALVWLWGRGRMSGSEDSDITQLKSRLNELEKRYADGSAQRLSEIRNLWDEIADIRERVARLEGRSDRPERKEPWRRS